MSGTAQQLGITPPDPTQALAVNPADPVPEMPGLGPLPGQLTLNPAIAPQVQGNARPLAPGEYLRNPNGSWSSEMTYTVPYNGGFAVVPGMWIVDGKPVRVDEDQATEYARQSGLNFQTYPDEATAEKASQAREDQWQTMQPQDAGKVAPLWAKPMSMTQGPPMSSGPPPSDSGFLNTLHRVRPQQPTDPNMPTTLPGQPDIPFGIGGGPEGGVLSPNVDPRLERRGAVSPQWLSGPTDKGAA